MRFAYTESVVPKKFGPREKGMQTLFLVIAVVSAIGAVFLNFILIVAALAAGFLYYRGRRNADAEYEYVHTNDIFDVDLVVGNASRKQLASVNLEKVLLVAPADSDELDDYENLKVVDYSGDAGEGECYAMICKDGAKSRILLLKLDPEMYKSLKHWIPGKVK